MQKYPDISPQQFVDDLQERVEHIQKICFIGYITKHGTIVFELLPNQKISDLTKLRASLSQIIKDLKEERGNGR